MWSYYGSKGLLAAKYPKPINDTIIEPFAGSAKYALEHFEKEVILFDKYETIINIWKWLQKCSTKDILSLPRQMEGGQRVDSINFDCKEASDLMGFLCGFAMERPRVSASRKRMETRPNHINFGVERIAKDLHKIKHWKIELGCYTGIENIQATWFIDPPYASGGHAYIHNKIDYEKLSEYCKERIGQVIVCENASATWLPFREFNTQKGTRGIKKEGIWTNEQQSLTVVADGEN